MSENTTEIDTSNAEGGQLDAIVIRYVVHERFNRTVWTFEDDFTGALAKWLVKLSPYTVPENLSICIKEFKKEIGTLGDFTKDGMAEIYLGTLTKRVNLILEGIPEIMALNKPISGHNHNIFTSRYHNGPPNPDDDFIDIMALAQNITCEFVNSADAECWLDKDKVS